MNLEKILTEKAKEAIVSLYGAQPNDAVLQIQETRKEFEGNYTLVVFPLLKISKQSPEATATAIGSYLQANCEEVQTFNVIKGFLNLVITDACWLKFLSGTTIDEQYGYSSPPEGQPQKMVEYSSPNTNKPLHLGHIRNNLLGYSLSKIMQANGYRVVKTNIVNDRGIHICKSMLAWKKWGEGTTPESTGKKGDHLIGDFYVLFDKKYKEEVKDIHINKDYDRLPPGEKSAILGNEKKIELYKDMSNPPVSIKKLREGIIEIIERNSPLMREAREMLRQWEAGDKETVDLWHTMNTWVYAGFAETYKRLGVDFDKIYYESDTYLVGKEQVLSGLEKNIFQRKEDGSVWADLTADGLDNKLLLRADGTSVYMTQDIGTAKLRFDDYTINKMVYVVGNEQNYHFQVLSLLLDKLGFEFGKGLVHFSYGMVELPEGKMKSREGTVVDADDLVEEMVQTAKQTSKELGKLDGYTPEEANKISEIVGLGALKYFILKVDPRKNMTFNPKESIDFNGNTGPFIQYTYARIQSVLRKASEQGVTWPEQLPTNIQISTKEEELIQSLITFKEIVKEAAEQYSPAVIANYVYDLVKEYNQFYHDYSILKEEDATLKNFRLLLSANIGKVISNGMSLLGIDVPDRM